MQLTKTGSAQRFGPPFIVLYIVVLQMFSIFATDMYTPALPDMVTQFGESESIVNMTVLLFFAFNIVGMLLFGPLSDKTGRRPIILLMVSLFIVASLACAAATTIWALIGFRVVQAIACGGNLSLTLALVKDTFMGRSRETVLMITQAITVIGPILAPVFGAQMLLWFSWRAVFVALALLGVIGLFLAVLSRESLAVEDRAEGSLAASLKGLAVVAKNGRFMVFMLVTTMYFAVPFYCYLSLSPYIYESFFGLTPLEFSYFFAATAGLSVLGLLIYRLIGNHVSLKHLITVLLLLVAAIGVAMLCVGHISPWAFFACILVLQVIGSMVRPFSVNILFDLQSKDTGAASSMMNCTFSVVGVLGMLPVVLLSGNYITGLGVLICIGVAISLMLWVGLLRSSATIPGIK